MAVSARGCRVHEEVHARIDRIEAKLERVRQLLADPDAVERLRASLKREATSSG